MEYLSNRELSPHRTCFNYETLTKLKPVSDLKNNTRVQTTLDFAGAALMYWASNTKYMEENFLEKDEVISSYEEVESMLENSVTGTTDEECERAENARVRELIKGVSRYVRDEARVNDPAYNVSLKQNIYVTTENAPDIAAIWTELKTLPYRAKFDVVLQHMEQTPQGEDLLCIEGITFKGGKPWFTTIKGKQPIEFDPGVALDIRALETLVPDGAKARITRSFYHMKAAREIEGRPWDTLNFFSEGNSIRSLTEDFEQTERFKKSRPENQGMLDNLQVILTPHECTAEECAKCENKAFCTFAPVPEALEEKKQKEYKKMTYSENQQKVINHILGVMLCIAGPGSGKTACVTAHIAESLRRDVAEALKGTESPEEKNEIARKILKTYLCVSFTVAACDEMKERIVLMLNGEGFDVTSDDCTVVTFNSFCYTLVKKFYEELGFSAEPEVIDDIEMSSLCVGTLNQSTVNDLDYEHFRANTPNCRGALSILKKAVQIIKSADVDVNDPYAVEAVLTEQLPFDQRFMSKQSVKELVDFGDRFNQVLLTENRVLFGDQEPMGIRVLNNHPEYVTELGYSRIIVDEFQDTSPIQIDIVKILMNEQINPAFKSLLCVGDDYQAIYKFRGASAKFILNLQSTLGVPVETVYLTDNYRSTQEIVDYSNQFIALNACQLQKQMQSKNEKGVPAVVRGFMEKADELNYHVETAIRMHEEGFAWSDICCEVRTNPEAEKLALLFAQKGVPVRMNNPQKFMENSRVKAALDLMRAINNPEATEKYLGYIQALYNGEALQLHTSEELSAMILDLKNQFMHFADIEEGRQKVMFHKLLDQINVNDELYSMFLDKVYSKKDFASELDYMQKFYTYGENEAVRLQKKYDGLTISTCHSSKGLEWPVVILSITGFDSSMLRADAREATDGTGYDEARRVIYVAMTRAKKRLFITGQYISVSGKNSMEYDMFLQELYKLNGQEFVPVDTEAAAKKEERRKAYEDKRMKQEAYSLTSQSQSLLAGCSDASRELVKKSKTGKGSGKSRPMTVEETIEYNKLASHGRQMSLAELLSAL